MSNAIQVIWTFILDYTKGWGVRCHQHDYFQMYFCLSGAGVFVLDGAEICLVPNSCILIRPEQIHELYPITDGQLRLIDTKFYVRDDTLLKGIYATPQTMQVDNLHFRELQTLMRNEWASSEIYSKEIANSLFLQSLYCFLRTNTTQSAKSAFYQEVENRAAKLTGLEKRITDYLSLHFLEKLTLDRLASDFGYSKNHLCKVFKHSVGSTISEYVNFLRISKAYDIICCTNRKLSDISTLCGFSSIHYFSRIFHKIVGMSPSHARDQDRNSINTDIRLHGTFQYRYYTDNSKE